MHDEVRGGFLEEEAFDQLIKQESAVLMGKGCFLQAKTLWKGTET